MRKRLYLFASTFCIAIAFVCASKKSAADEQAAAASLSYMTCANGQTSSSEFTQVATNVKHQHNGQDCAHCHESGSNLDINGLAAGKRAPTYYMAGTVYATAQAIGSTAATALPAVSPNPTVLIADRNGVAMSSATMAGDCSGNFYQKTDVMNYDSRVASGSDAVVALTVTGGVITGYSITNAGTGYPASTTVQIGSPMGLIMVVVDTTTTGVAGFGTGSGAILTGTTNSSGQLATVSISNGGSGYVAPAYAIIKKTLTAANKVAGLYFQTSIQGGRTMYMKTLQGNCSSSGCHGAGTGGPATLSGGVTNPISGNANAVGTCTGTKTNCAVGGGYMVGEPLTQANTEPDPTGVAAGTVPGANYPIADPNNSTICLPAAAATDYGCAQVAPNSVLPITYTGKVYK